MFHRRSVAEATPRPHSDTSVDRAYADLGLDVIRFQLNATDLVSDRAADYRSTSVYGAVATEVVVDNDPVAVEAVPVVEQTLEIFNRHAKGRNEPADPRKPLAREIIDRVLTESWAEEADPNMPDERKAYTIRQYNALRNGTVDQSDYNPGSLTVEEAISRVGLAETFGEVRRGLKHWDLNSIARLPVIEQAATINGFVDGLHESLYPTPVPQSEPTPIQSSLLPMICANCEPDLRQDLLPIEL